MTPLANPILAMMPVPPMPMPPIIAISDLIRDLSVGMVADTSEAGSGHTGIGHIGRTKSDGSERCCHNQALLH